MPRITHAAPIVSTTMTRNAPTVGNGMPTLPKKLATAGMPR